MINLSCNQVATIFAVLVILSTVTTVQLVFGQTEISPVLLVPMAQSDQNIYLVWSGNDTGNGEIMFRASNDNGSTFAEKMNLSNSTASDSANAQIMASGNNVFVTWWERNQTSNEPAVRVSTDNGQTFGPVLKLATNGTIGESEEEEE